MPDEGRECSDEKDEQEKEREATKEDGKGKNKEEKEGKEKKDAKPKQEEKKKNKNKKPGVPVRRLGRLVVHADMTNKELKQKILDAFGADNDDLPPVTHMRLRERYNKT